MIAGGVVALIIIVGIVAALLFNINSYRSKFETAVSGATGLDVRINGKMGLSFFPLGVSAEDVHVTGEGGEFLSLKSIKIGVRLMPLLKGQLEATRCVLVKPAVTIVRSAEGKYNFEAKPTEGPGAPFGLKNLKLSEGTLSYLDKKTGEKTELKGVNLAAKDLSVADISGEIMKNLSFTGSLTCMELLRKGLKIENIKGPVKVDKGVYSFKPLTMDALGGRGEGDLTADVSEPDAVYATTVKVSKLDFDKLEAFFGTNKVIGGKGDLSASLTVKEKGRRILMSGLDVLSPSGAIISSAIPWTSTKSSRSMHRARRFTLSRPCRLFLRRTAEYHRAQGIPLWGTLLPGSGRKGHHHPVRLSLEDKRRQGRRCGLCPCDET